MLPKSLGWPLLKFLKNKSIDFFLVFRAQVKEHSLVNVFNPCFKDIDDRIFISFRAIDANDINEKILSYLYCYKKREGTFEIKNYSIIKYIDMSNTILIFSIYLNILYIKHI